MNTVNIRTKNWVWWLVIGAIFLVLGLVLLSSPVLASISSVLVFGSLLVAGGIIHLVTAFLDKHSTHLWLHLVIAALTIVVGFLMLFSPVVTLAALTLLIAAFFLSSGLFRIIGSLITRFKGWGWYLASGIISLILGILILMHWPSASLWVIGLFIGIDFIFAGWSLIMIALFDKKGHLLT